MIVTNKISELYALEWIGIFGAIKAYKNGELTAEETQAINPRAGIYQTKVTYEGRKISHMKLYKPTNPQTPEQQAHRFIFKDGVLLWQNLTDEEKKAYNVRAKQYRFSGFNLFMREYLNTQKLLP